MVHIEAVKHAVRGQIDACALLGGNDDGCGVENGLFARQRGEPVDRRVGADSGGEDFRDRCGKLPLK